jgi:hypothetical protein
MLAFSPWIAFWIISSGHSMLRLQVGIFVVAVLVAVMCLTKLHRGATLWAGVLFFAFALVSVALLRDMWVIQHFFEQFPMEVPVGTQEEVLDIIEVKKGVTGCVPFGHY